MGIPELFAKSQPSRGLSCVDHSHDLAQHARRFHDQGYFEIAVLLYATACEHWVNDVVSKLFRRDNLVREDVVQIIRDTHLRAKCTWFLKLLGGPPLNAQHLKALFRLTDLRNEFAHYKWKSFDLDKADPTRPD